MRLLFLLIIVLSCLLLPNKCARILAINPVLGRSHWAVFSALTEELSRRNHEIVMISAFPLQKPRANYTDIDISKYFTDDNQEHILEEGVKLLYNIGKNSNPFIIPFILWQFALETSQMFFNIPEIKNILQDKRGFDLVIVETFYTEPLFGFADYFKAPLVTVCPFGGFSFMNYGSANPIPLSYVPNAMLTYSDKMNFPQRLFNTIFTIVSDIGHQLYYLPKQESFRYEFFGPGKNVWELDRSVSLTLFNNHFSIHYPRPLVPSIVEVGGIHISRKQGNLPEDIKNFLDNSDDGVIYFSMGSHLRSDLMPQEQLNAFLSTFFELPQRVLWKFENEHLVGKSSNVMIKEWLPQQDILAHPHVKLFITHGGLLSSQEAAYHGVPLLGIPIYGDQGLNMEKAQNAGFGLKLDFTNVTKTSLLWAINELLYNSKYRDGAKNRSLVYRDQPETPLERAVFWTEYVIRHKGAPHLKTAAVNMSWYQLYNIDIYLLLLFCIIFPIIMVKTLCCNVKTLPTVSQTRKNK